MFPESVSKKVIDVPAVIAYTDITTANRLCFTSYAERKRTAKFDSLNIPV